MPSYLLCRRGIWHYRRRVPAECASQFGKREILISLKTRSAHEARRMADIHHARYNVLFFELRQQSTMKDRDLFNLARGLRTTRFEERVIEDSDGKREILRRIDPAAIEALAAAGIPPEQLASLVADFLKKKEGNGGDQDIKEEKNNEEKDNGLTLSDAITAFNDARRIDHQDDAGWEPDAGDMIKFRRLTELLGSNKFLSDIQREDARYVQQHISQLPSASVKTRGMDIHKVLELSKAEGNYKRVSSVQVNNHITLYSSVFAWAITEGHYNGSNPFHKLRVKQSKKRKNNARRDKFEREEIESIFSEAIFSDYRKESKRNTKLKPYRYWGPLIGLFTGARPCEIGALHAKDVKKVNEVWVFDFNENDFGKCSKTHNAIRRTPIHSNLISLGLLDFAKSIDKSENERLFPELPYEEKDGYGRYLNERFVESILKPLGIYEKNRKVFYSFRHTLSTELYKCGVDQLRREQICGREAEEKSTGDSFYVKDDELPTLRDELEKVDFSDELKNTKSWEM